MVSKVNAHDEEQLFNGLSSSFQLLVMIVAIFSVGGIAGSVYGRDDCDDTSRLQANASRR